MTQDILIWWLVIQVIGILALPITTSLFRALPDRGYAFSKTLGLLLLSYGAWLVAMFGIAPFGKGLLIFLLLLMGIVYGVLFYRNRQRNTSPTPDDQPQNKPSVYVPTPVAYLKEHWASILVYEGLFLAALLFLAWMRGFQPDPWGTERPMDFAFFNAIQRSSLFPPHDPWMAGYSINYYYFGYLMMAVVALLSGIDPSPAFNLSLALIFALTAINIAGLLSNLVTLTYRYKLQAAQPAQHTPSPPTSERGTRFVAIRSLLVVVGTLLVLIAGNQVGALQVIIGDYRIVALDDTQLIAALQQSIGDLSQDEVKEITLPYPVRTGDGNFGTLTTLERTDRIKDFNWWWASRALWDEQIDDRLPEGEQAVRVYNITEFPFFSFWLGDMHPHVMALPFGLLAMALALTTLARQDRVTFARGKYGWGDLLLAGLILGSLYTINSWDMPTYTLLLGAALLLVAMRHPKPDGTIAWGALGGQVGVLALTMFVLFIPFYLTFHSFAGANTEPLIDLPILGKLSEIVAPLNGSQTGWHAFLIIFGLFLIPLTAFAYLIPAQRLWSPATDYLLLGLTPLLVVIGLITDFPLMAMGGLMLFAFARATQRIHTPAEAFVLLVLALGCAITLGTDLIFVRDVFNSRMNTIFKFYYQVWLLWGSVTAYVMWWLLVRGWQAVGEGTGDKGKVSPLRRVVVGLISGVFLLLLGGSLVYPAINLYHMNKGSERKGLDGETPRERSPAGEESIRWLREHASQGSVLLEMVPELGGAYNTEGYGGVSASTGIPTVMGWTGHERQWRGGQPSVYEQIGPRQADVDRIYSTTDVGQAQNLLNKYNVTHVYIGRLERDAYTAESLAKFAKMGEQVFQKDDVTIYHISPIP